jgi:hypothetical protein
LIFSNFDLDSVFPLIAFGFIPWGGLFFELINQDDPSENGTYRVPPYPPSVGLDEEVFNSLTADFAPIIQYFGGTGLLSDDPDMDEYKEYFKLVRADEEDQTIRFENNAKQVTFNLIWAGAGFFEGLLGPGYAVQASLEFFVASDGVGNLRLAFQSGTSFIVKEFFEDNHDGFSYDSEGSIPELHPVGFETSTTATNLCLWGGDEAPVITVPTIIAGGVSLVDQNNSKEWFYSGNTGWFYVGGGGGGGGGLTEEEVQTLIDGRVPDPSEEGDGRILVVDDGTLVYDNAPSVDLSGYVPTSRTVSAGEGLTGGGDLTANRTLSVDPQNGNLILGTMILGGH